MSKVKYNQAHPLIKELLELLDSKGLALTYAVKQLEEFYLDTSEFKSYYQRITKFKTGEYKNLSDQEERAIKRFIHIESNTHLYGSIIESVGNVEGKLKEITKALNSGFHNPANTKRIMKDFAKLKELNA